MMMQASAEGDKPITYDPEISGLEKNGPPQYQSSIQETTTKSQQNILFFERKPHKSADVSRRGRHFNYPACLALPSYNM